MLQREQLNLAFQTYWDDMVRCRSGGAYWSLLHVTLCIPDICAALGSQNGETTGKLYRKWCGRFLPDQLISSDERYWMRCTVLHQGRAVTNGSPRYSGFAFTQPSTGGAILHRQVLGTLLHLDVGELARETQDAVKRWIVELEQKSQSLETINVGRNLTSLVSVAHTVVNPSPPSLPQATMGVFTPPTPGAFSTPMVILTTK
jgi:hypothetical protein